MRFRFENPIRAASAVGAFSLNDVDSAPRAVPIDHLPVLSGNGAGDDDAKRSCDVFASHSRTEVGVDSSPLVSNSVSELSAIRVSDSATFAERA